MNVKAMKRFNFLSAVLVTLSSVELVTSNRDLMLASPMTIEKIKPKTLEQERVLFEKFIATYCDICVQQPAAKQVINQLISREEGLLANADFGGLFFRALHEDQIVGYISCDILPSEQVHIRQLIIDPQMFDVTLVKELLFAIFAAAPKTKHVTLSCPATCLDLTLLFEELGFVCTGIEVYQAIGQYVVYELKIHPKCKICDVLYADIWENEEDSDSNWSDSAQPVDEELS